MRKVKEHIDAAATGFDSLLFLSADAGFGKSRIVNEG